MITEKSIIEGINSVKLRYRLEKVENKALMDLLPDSSVIYMDGSHNPHGAKVIADFLLSENEKDGVSNYLINGRTKYTDSRSFLYQFLNVVKFVGAVRVKLEAIPESPEIICKAGNEIGIPCLPFSDIVATVKHINLLENPEQNNEKKPVRIVICGSFYLAKDLRLIK